MKPEDKLLLSVGSVAGITLLVALASALTPKRPSHHVTATVVEIGVGGARFPTTLVIAHASGAIEAQASIRYPGELRCEVGDLVDGEQTGITLVIDPKTCRRRQTSSTRRP
jgi:hypothetical protein